MDNTGKLSPPEPLPPKELCRVPHQLEAQTGIRRCSSVPPGGGWKVLKFIAWERGREIFTASQQSDVVWNTADNCSLEDHTAPVIFPNAFVVLFTDLFCVCFCIVCIWYVHLCVWLYIHVYESSCAHVLLHTYGGQRAISVLFIPFTLSCAIPASTPPLRIH